MTTRCILCTTRRMASPAVDCDCVLLRARAGRPQRRHRARGAASRRMAYSREPPSQLCPICTNRQGDSRLARLHSLRPLEFFSDGPIRSRPFRPYPAIATRTCESGRTHMSRLPRNGGSADTPSLVRCQEILPCERFCFASFADPIYNVGKGEGAAVIRVQNSNGSKIPTFCRQSKHRWPLHPSSAQDNTNAEFAVA